MIKSQTSNLTAGINNPAVFISDIPDCHILKCYIDITADAPDTDTAAFNRQCSSGALNCQVFIDPQIKPCISGVHCSGRINIAKQCDCVAIACRIKCCL